ncbi:MAG: hypothetical protein JST92_15395 [Deltaproteobacteria bacterium]|nr:hypothetical protein [Deltaproteobacteria bacterium]
MGLLLRALVLVGFASALAFGVNAVRPDGLRMGSFEAPATCGAAEAAGTPLEVSPEDATRLCGSPDAVIADARTAARYAEGHVAGAIHLPCDASGSVATGAIAALAGKHTVIVYGESTADAQPVAASLRRRIHAPSLHVSVLRGGFAAWAQAGLACASGPCDDCALKESQAQQSVPAENRP